MAHNYYRCKTCGCVWRIGEKDDEFLSYALTRLFEEKFVCVNNRCMSTDVLETFEKSLPRNWNMQELTGKMLALKGGALAINTPVQLNYVSYNKTGQMKIGQPITRPTTTLAKAIERLNQGKPLAQDVHNRQHLHDGGPFGNKERVLPIVSTKRNYYTEYGVHSESRGWEINLSSERLVTGKCGELYYSSLHYKTGSWFVFSPFNGQWRAFQM